MTKEPVMESAEEVATQIVDRIDRDVALYRHGSETTAARKICIDRITDLLTSYANAKVKEAEVEYAKAFSASWPQFQEVRNAALDEAAQFLRNRYSADEFLDRQKRGVAFCLADDMTRALKSKEPS